MIESGRPASPSSVRQLFRYGAVGIASNLAGYLLFLLITYMGIEPKRAMTALYVSGAAIGFMGNRQWAFSHKGSFLATGVRYAVAHCAGYMMNFLILLLFVDRMGYPHQAVQAVAIIVVALFLFVAFKLFVFPAAAPDGQNS